MYMPGSATFSQPSDEKEGTSNSYSRTYMYMYTLIHLLQGSQTPHKAHSRVGTHSSARDNVRSSDNFRVIMPRDRSISYSCGQNVWTKACSLL